MTAAEISDRTELEAVEAWRMQALERAGFPAEAAEQIARRLDIDLHHAVGLLEQGCPPDIAARILL